MERIPKKAYTFEFKLEAVRLVESGQRVAEAARSLGVVEQTLFHWIKAHKAGKLTANGRGSKLTADQIEIRQLRAENGRLKMERDILPPQRRKRPVAGDPAWEKLWRTSRRARSEVYLHRQASASLACTRLVPGSGSQLHRLPSTPVSVAEDCMARSSSPCELPKMQSSAGFFGITRNGCTRRSATRVRSSSSMPSSCSVKPLESRLWEYGNRVVCDFHTSTTSTTTGLFPSTPAHMEYAF